MRARRRASRSSPRRLAPPCSATTTSMSVRAVDTGTPSRLGTLSHCFPSALVEARPSLARPPSAAPPPRLKSTGHPPAPPHPPARTTDLTPPLGWPETAEARPGTPPPPPRTPHP